MVIIQVVIFVLCLGTAFLIGGLAKKEPKKRRRKKEDYDDDDDQPRRSRRRREEEDFDDEPPRSRRRREEDDADDEPRRPRRRRDEEDVDNDPDERPARRQPARAIDEAPTAAEIPPSSLEITCTKCNKVLKVPANVVGKAVRCPACNSVFKAEAGSTAVRTPPVRDRRDRSRDDGEDDEPRSGKASRR